MRPWLACVLLLWFGAAHAEASVVDDSGARVVLARPATRIVSLAPHLTELLFAAGAGERLVGVVDFSDYPAAARALPRIGSYANLDLERIVALRPDLVVAWGSGNPPGQLQRLRALGLPVYVSEPQRLPAIAATLRRLGTLAGSDGEAPARDFAARLAGLRERYAGAAPLAVFYEIWPQPLMTVGGVHVISDVIALCGGRNVFATLDQPAAAVALEAVLAADPDVIVASGMDEARPDWLDAWQRWPALRAVKRANLYFVPPDLLQRHTPRILDGAEQLCRALAAARQKKENR